MRLAPKFEGLPARRALLVKRKGALGVSTARARRQDSLSAKRSRHCAETADERQTRWEFGIVMTHATDHVCGRHHPCAAVGRTRSVQVTNNETSRRRAILGFEYHANVVSILF
jgi:hypothetical protein